MDNKEYKELIDIPEELDEIILEGVKLGEEYNKNNKKGNNKKGKILIATAAAVAIITTTAIISPEVVKAIPGIKSIYDLFDGANKYKKNSNKMNLTVEDKGVVVTLDELTMTDWKMVATLTISGEMIDDNVEIRASGGLMGKNSPSGTSNCRIKKISDNTRVAVVEMQLDGSIEEDNFDMQVGIKDFFKDGKEITGKWTIETNVDREDILIEATEKKYSDASIEYGGVTYKVDELKMSAIGNSIKILAENKKISGRELTNVEYVLKDDKGRYLLTEHRSGMASDEEGWYTESLEILNNLDGLEYIDVYPVQLEEGNTFKKDEENGRTTIQGVTELDAKDIVRVKSKTDSQNWIINKNKDFCDLKELKGRKIKVSNTNSIEIQDVEVAKDYVELVVKYDKYYDGIGFSLMDEQFNTRDGGFQAANDWMDIENRVRKVRFDKIDLNKKYILGATRMIDLNINDANKIRIDLQ